MTWGQIEQSLKLLGQIAAKYPPASAEAKVIALGADALFVVYSVETRDRFARYLRERPHPPTRRELLHAKAVGVELGDRSKNVSQPKSKSARASAGSARKQRTSAAQQKAKKKHITGQP